MSLQQNISLTLPSLPIQERRNLPNCSAIYFALSSSHEILYIGRTNNLARRWLAHHRLSQLIAVSNDVRIAWLECGDSTLLPVIEVALIKHFQPIFNDSPILYIENEKVRTGSRAFSFRLSDKAVQALELLRQPNESLNQTAQRFVIEQLMLHRELQCQV